MLYVAIFFIGACVGAYIDRWWANYIADCDDLTTIHRHERARDAIDLRRWN